MFEVSSWNVEIDGAINPSGHAMASKWNRIGIWIRLKIQPYSTRTKLLLDEIRR
jgi:hypothetical protein